MCRLHTERLLASGSAQQELVLLHGWGSSLAAWRPLLPALRPWANITLVDLPGLGGAGEGVPDPEALVDLVLAQAPTRAVYVGWSLGGQLAALLAGRAPERVSALVTLASNPRFLETGAWPGVADTALAELRTQAAEAPLAAQKRLEAQQCLGQPAAGALRRALAACRGSAENLETGLAWLANLDLRDTLNGLACPQYHLLGADDSLLPPAVADALTALLAPRDTARVEVLAAAGHALPLQVPQAVADRLQALLDEDWLEAHDLLGGPAAEGAAPLPPKAAVADSFSRAAGDYDRVAQLQRQVGERLLQQLPAPDSRVETVLDLGCGTGFFRPALRQRYPGARYLGLDLAPGMLGFARAAQGSAGEWVAGDAEQLPLATGSVDLVFSSLALQWCPRPEAVFAELARVLRPGGRCLFSTLGPETLCELRQSWAAVDAHRHVNEFLPPARLSAAAQHLPCAALDLTRETICLQYSEVRELFADLKTLGAHNMNRGRRPGLGGRRALLGMISAYEQFRVGGQLPASYEVLFGTLERA